MLLSFLWKVSPDFEAMGKAARQPNQFKVTVATCGCK
jgi:hypothetical protein